MRLLCPNCDAEYEVDASAIPENGRDVQCSNCGHAWFQQHPDTDADYEAESALYDPPPPLPVVDTAEAAAVDVQDFDIAEDIPDAGDNQPQHASDDPEAILDAMQDDLPEYQPAAEAMPAPVHEIGADALKILREEAEHETAQRLAEQSNTQAIEQQTEMGLTEPAASPIVARRVARLKGIQPAPAPVAARDRLPAVDDISAALRSGDDLAPMPDTLPVAKRGSRAGFWTMLIAAGTSVAAYIFSPDIAAKLPQLAAPLAQYVNVIDGLRDQLDVLIAGVQAWVVAQGWL